MEFYQNKEKVTLKPLFGNAVSINDIRDREFNGEELSEKEKQALVNFDRYRLKELNKEQSEQEFQNKYIRLQVMANLSPYDEFLKEKYTIKESGRL